MGKVATVNRDVVGVSTKSYEVGQETQSYTYHFPLEEVLKWKPLK